MTTVYTKEQRSSLGSVVVVRTKEVQLQLEELYTHLTTVAFLLHFVRLNYYIRISKHVQNVSSVCECM